MSGISHVTGKQQCDMTNISFSHKQSIVAARKKLNVGHNRLHHHRIMCIVSFKRMPFPISDKHFQGVYILSPKWYTVLENDPFIFFSD